MLSCAGWEREMCCVLVGRGRCVVVCWLGEGGVLLCAVCLTSQQHMSQARACKDNRTCCHTDKLQSKLTLSPSHSLLTPGQPVPAVTLERQEPNMVATKNNNNRIQKHNSRFSTISSLRREPSPTRTLKRPGRNRVQITSSAHHVQHVVLRATWYEGTAQLLSLTEFELDFIG